MSVESAASEGEPSEDKRVLAGFALQAFEGASARASAWSCVRALAVAGFLGFAVLTMARWLRLDIITPFKDQRVDVGETFAVSAAEHDVALLQRWLPAAGKIGYLSEKPDLARFETRMRLAPLLLDYDWQKHGLVLVDFPVGPARALIESPSYQLVAELTQAKSFARGMRIYQRVR